MTFPLIIQDYLRIFPSVSSPATDLLGDLGRVFYAP